MYRAPRSPNDTVSAADSGDADPETRNRERLAEARRVLKSKPFALWCALCSTYLQYLYIYEHRVFFRKPRLPRLPGIC